ncbi:MAG: group 1 truncated hemoglobin [Planctomycetes bacterium]|nr:group 1 truncated hemoglobin [Planctomycetota bacterium]
MNIPHHFSIATLITSLLLISCGGGEAAATVTDSAEQTGEPTLSATDTIAAMVADCEDSANARAARHNETPLYERLGGQETITAFVSTLIEVHQKNDLVKPYLEGVDLEKLTTNLSDFISAGTGGTAEYKGQSVLDSHTGMGITPEIFLAAGGDIGEAMQMVGWGPDEQAELMCIILSMRDDVILK